MENYVIVRADRAGVFFGKLVSKSDKSVELADARKLYYWDGAAAIEEISLIGTKKPESCRFTVFVPSMIINNWEQILPCSQEAVNTIKKVKEWKA